MATKGLDNLGAEAAHNTTALNPMMGGINRKELLAAVTMMLRRTRTSPIAGAKYAGRMTKEGAAILVGKSKRAPDARDRRFQDPAWKHNPFYKRTLQTYLAMQDNLHNWVDDLKLEELERARAQFVMGMIIDAIAPTNTLVGNPMALKQIINSGGLNLVKGLKNLYDDMTKNGGMPSMVDKRPFKVGENVANTPGKVVWKNDLMELIQYTPTTDQVHEIPFFWIPPQINKFYASDLAPEKSVVRYLLSQGIQVFMVSWANPTAKNSHWGLVDYVDSLILATEVIKHITGNAKLNVSGACSGGITTASFASTLAAGGDNRINSLTLQVCVLDPQRGDSELGEIVSDGSIEIARKMSKKKGILKGEDLARMFAWMRPNDLVWGYVINNYLMGMDPPPFDVLFWNADVTNLPAQLHSDYLDMSLVSPFANPGKVKFAGHIADLTKVDCDTFIMAGVKDHITPWKACYRTIGLLGSKNTTFVLSNSGHIQSLLNPPGNPKSKYFVNPNLTGSAEEWAAQAEERAGSWWVKWAEWLKAHSGPMKDSPAEMGSKTFRPIVDAPGEYVFG